jgi:hypothetical protein
MTRRPEDPQGDDRDVLAGRFWRQLKAHLERELERPSLPLRVAEDQVARARDMALTDAEIRDIVGRVTGSTPTPAAGEGSEVPPLPPLGSVDRSVKLLVAGLFVAIMLFAASSTMVVRLQRTSWTLPYGTAVRIVLDESLPDETRNAALGRVFSMLDYGIRELRALASSGQPIAGEADRALARIDARIANGQPDAGWSWRAVNPETRRPYVDVVELMRSETSGSVRGDAIVELELQTMAGLEAMIRAARAGGTGVTGVAAPLYLRKLRGR